MYFINTLTKRVVLGNKNATILVVGDYTGCGKSYLSMKLAEQFHIANNLPTFTIKNVGFFPEDFLNFVRHSKKTNSFVFDDAGCSVASRDWYSETNKILTSVVESFRFLNLITFITVPIRSLIDKNIRELSNYLITVSSPGNGKLYELKHAHFAGHGKGEVFQRHLLNFSDVNLPSEKLCVDYEKIKAEIMLGNYADQQERIMAKKERDRRMILRSRPDEIIMEEIKADIGRYRNENKVDIDLIQHFQSVGYRRALHIRNLLNKMDGIK